MYYFLMGNDVFFNVKIKNFKECTIGKLLGKFEFMKSLNIEKRKHYKLNNVSNWKSWNPTGGKLNPKDFDERERSDQIVSQLTCNGSGLFVAIFK